MRGRASPRKNAGKKEERRRVPKIATGKTLKAKRTQPKRGKRKRAFCLRKNRLFTNLKRKKEERLLPRVTSICCFLDSAKDSCSKSLEHLRRGEEILGASAQKTLHRCMLGSRVVIQRVLDFSKVSIHRVLNSLKVSLETHMWTAKRWQEKTPTLWCRAPLFGPIIS